MRVFGICVCMMGLVACGGQPEADAEDMPVSGLGESLTVHSDIASIELLGSKVTFLHVASADGDEGITIREEASAYTQETPLERLEEMGPMTSLEIYLALGGDADDVPEILREQHSVEAEEMDRENTEEVVGFEFDANAPVEKSVAACESWVFRKIGDTAVDTRSSRNWITGSNWLPVGGNWSFSTLGTARVGVCNESSAGMTAQVAYDMSGDSAGWQYYPRYNVGGFSRVYWRPVHRFVGGNNCGPLFCLNPTRYAINGSSTSNRKYHLKTGMEFFDGVIR